MTTLDLTLPSSSGSVSGRSLKRSPYKTYQLENTIDFSVAANALAQNDVAQIIVLPGNCFVRQVRWEILVVEGAARNFSIGDGVTTDGYLLTTSGNTLAEGCIAPVLVEATPNTIAGFGFGKYYASTDTIDVKALTSGGIVAMKLRVVAAIEDYN